MVRAGTGNGAPPTCAPIAAFPPHTHTGVSSSSQANIFDEYQMEGVSSQDNEICLEVTPENIFRALRTVHNAKSVKVKLTKKHCPCLTVAAELVSQSQSNILLTPSV